MLLIDMQETWLTSLVFWTLGLLLAAGLITWAPAMIIKRRGIARLRDRCKGKLALTYDDGPGRLLTAGLIELLARNNARASFFLVGFRAEREPKTCDQLMKAGHELGCHTQMHRKPWRIAPWTTAADVDRGYRSLSRWVAPNAPFRPPFGKLTTWSWLAARRRRAPLCWWTRDGGDTHEHLPDPRIVAQQLIDDGGGVVLMHSHDRGRDRHE
jgi:peptidoglycan/xylan/chitin deacetylase (PgdA/CDA1 family)